MTAPVLSGVSDEGGHSYMHSGMYGMYALQESVRQMRAAAPAQIPQNSMHFGPRKWMRERYADGRAEFAAGGYWNGSSDADDKIAAVGDKGALAA
jgi:hypothetical protein